MGGRAIAVVEAGHVFDVAVILFVEIDSVPAGLEVNLSAQTVDAACCRHAWLLFARGDIEASIADTVSLRTLAVGDELLGVVGACAWNARDHAEAGREGLDVGFIVAATEIVDGHSTVLDLFEGAVAMVVIEVGSPVGGLVGSDLTGRAIGLSQRVIVGRETEAGG